MSPKHYFLGEKKDLAFFHETEEGHYVYIPLWTTIKEAKSMQSEKLGNVAWT